MIIGHQDLLGELLVQEGLITPELLEAAIAKRKQKKESLGSILVEMGACQEEEIARVLAQQAGVPYISLDSLNIDGSVTALVPREIVQKYNALPVGFEGHKLLVAMLNPKDVIAIDDLRILTSYEVQPVVCPDSELLAAIERLGRTEVRVEQGQEEEAARVDISKDQDESPDRPAIQLVNQILMQAVHAKASDIHIEPQEKVLRIRFRIDGVLHNVKHMSIRMHPMLVSRVKVMASMDITERRVPQDGRITLRVAGRDIDIRVASIPTANGEQLSLRLLDRSSKLITLESLGFPGSELKKYRRIMNLPYGFILVTGPTGSGKSTTLYATLSALNRPEKHIITVEDPIEYLIEGVNQMQVNTRAGLIFANGLRSILRNDPDIIMIGEIRDQETARIAVESALTGHLVFSTLHTNDASGTVSRLIDMGIEAFLISSSLVGVVAQRLVRVLCKHCKKPFVLSRQEILASVPDFPIDDGAGSVTVYRASGCVRCSHTGYSGQVGLFELLLVDEAIQRLALRLAPVREIREAAIGQGMVTMQRDGLMKVKQGVTSLEEVMRVVV